MNQNGNFNNSGEKNKNEVPIDSHATAPEQIMFIPVCPNDHSTFSRTWYSTSHSKSSTNVTQDKGHHMKNIAKVSVLPCKNIQFIQER